MLNQTHNEIPEKEYEERHERMLLENTTQNNNDKLLYESDFDKNIVPAVENSVINSLTHENNNNYTKECKGHVENEMRGLTDGCKNDNRNKRFDIESTKIDKCGRILCIESHSNGTIYEEYVIKLSINREIKIKYPIVLNNNEAMVRLEFMDNEIDYEKAPIDRMLILFKNIHNKSQYYIFLPQKMKNFSLSLPRGVCSSILLRRPSASTSFLPRKSAGTRCTNPVHYHTVSTVRHFLPPDQ